MNEGLLAIQTRGTEYPRGSKTVAHECKTSESALLRLRLRVEAAHESATHKLRVERKGSTIVEVVEIHPIIWQHTK
jgi:hypothetical protein